MITVRMLYLPPITSSHIKISNFVFQDSILQSLAHINQRLSNMESNTDQVIQRMADIERKNITNVYRHKRPFNPDVDPYFNTHAREENNSVHSISDYNISDHNISEHMSEHEEEDRGDRADIVRPDKIELTTTNAKIIKRNRELFTTLEKLFPDRFTNNIVNKPQWNESLPEGSKHAIDKSDFPYLIINSDFSDTWFDPQHTEEEGDKVLVWKEGAKIPINYASKPPSDRATDRSPLPRLPYLHFDQPWVKNLSTTKIIPKVKFPSYIQGNTEEISVTTSNQAQMDLSWRQSLIESLINEELISMLISLLSKEELRVEALPDSNAEAFAPMIHLAQLISQNIDRAKNFQINSFIINKNSLRKTVLDQVVAPPTTASVLKRSDFGSDTLFGPLPESFRELALKDSSKSIKKIIKRVPKQAPATSHMFTPSVPAHRGRASRGTRGRGSPTAAPGNNRRGKARGVFGKARGRGAQK